MQIKPQNLFYSIIDFIFPSYCVNCKKQVRYIDAFLCRSCFDKIVLLTGKCEKCSSTLTGKICNLCSDRKLYIERNIIIAEYSGVMKEILHGYKFERKKKLYKMLSQLAINAISGISDGIPGMIDIVIPVPVNRKKRWKRGFNQSALIAEEISKKVNKKFANVLSEKYNFKTQKNLGYRDRFLNILDRYRVKNKKIVEEKNILLVDDVLTTGATVNECARILKSSGAGKVYSLTIAGAHIKRVDN